MLFTLHELYYLVMQPFAKGLFLKISPKKR
nr:MAG TPA: hypothetical protein [Caudoviricetes sp.]